MLRTKSLTELRGIAQSFGIDAIFSKDQNQLIQDIELKQGGMVPQSIPLPPKPEYDARLMSKPPSRTSSQNEVEMLLMFHVKRGLILTFPEPETWAMAFEKRTDTGTLRQPLRNILTCADRIMKKGVARE